MAENTSLDDHTDQETAEAKSDVFERIGQTLDEWRAKIDELVVQLDLANLDLRDEVRKNFDATQSAYLAARSKFSDARADARSSLHTLETGIEKLLRDLALTFEETQTAIKRAREE
jgi:hypothetical protein